LSAWSLKEHSEVSLRDVEHVEFEFSISFEFDKRPADFTRCERRSTLERATVDALELALLDVITGDQPSMCA
jgi:hypothetical protein